MFTPIIDELQKFINDLSNLISELTVMRTMQQNSNMVIEYDGRLDQAEEILDMFSEVKINIDKDIELIMKNATDGNYSAKMEVLENEVNTYKDKIYLLEQELKKYKTNEKLELTKKAELVNAKSKIKDDEIEGNMEL